MSRIVEAQKQYEQKVEEAIKAIKDLGLQPDATRHYIQVCLAYALKTIQAEPQDATKVKKHFETALQQEYTIHN